VRLATWNVNSLRARLERVLAWTERNQPDILCMQETKLADDAVPLIDFAALGYEVAHHGSGTWNGVAIASRVGIDGVVAGLPETEDWTDEGGRFLTAECGGVRVVSVYVPNGRVVGSEFYDAKLAWLDHLDAWVRERNDPADLLALCGDFNVAPEDVDVWDPRACHGGTHVSPREREAFAKLRRFGLTDVYRAHHPEPDRYTWWDYRAGHFHKNLGMRIDHLLATRPLAERSVWAEIDREARKGKPTPSDHAPLLMDVDEPGHPLDAGWASAEGRIAARRAVSG